MIAIIDYGMGNLKSITNALDFLGADFIVTNKIDETISVDKIILPGVGSFGEGMRNLKDLQLDNVLKEEVVEKGKPFLGICLGMQMLADEGCEGGRSEGLGFLRAEVKKLEPKEVCLKVPHVGWNNVSFKKTSPLFKNVPQDADFYFVHSYALFCRDEQDIAAVCDYGGEFVAAVQKGNIFAVQFHPEKGQHYGMQVLINFVDLDL